RDVPALPARAFGPVGEVDVVAVEAVALVEPAEVVQHLAAEEEERAEQPVRGDGLDRALVEQVVAALAVGRVEQEPERRAADEGAADGREAPPRGLAAAVRVAQLGAGDPAARMALGEGSEGPDR